MTDTTTTPTTAEARHYTVVGAGAIGGMLAYYLDRAGCTVDLVDADAAHVDAIRAHGLVIERGDGDVALDLPAAHLDDAPETLGRVLLAVKSQATRTAAAWIAPRLAPDGFVVSMQNGLNEADIAAAVGEDRTVAAFVDLSADVVGPGRVLDGGGGAMALGEYRGAPTERVRDLAHDLRVWGEPVVTDNVRGFLWSKLAYATMLTITAVADAPFGELIDRHRPTMHGLAREVCLVARAQGVRLEHFDEFYPDAYLPEASEEERQHATDLLTTWQATLTKNRSGIWRDVWVRHRHTEVSAQFTPVIAAARRYGVPTPLLDEMLRVIDGLDAGRVDSDEAHLDRFDEFVRTVSTTTGPTTGATAGGAA